MRLQDIINAGGYCAWSGVQRRPLVDLTDYTRQGQGGHGTPGDHVEAATRGAAASGLRVLPASMAGGIRFGRGTR